MKVAVFRPDDERLEAAVRLLEELGAEPVADPMLAIDPTNATPRVDADYVILTSKTGVELADEAGWAPTAETIVCAIGDSTADALRDHSYRVDRVPEEFSSTGVVAELAGEVEGARVEVARSDHGSPVLLDGLNDAGAYVHETVLYELHRPEGAGESAEMAARRELQGACFTSSLTVEYFLEVADDLGIKQEAIDGLNEAVVGTIGEPTKRTAEGAGIGVDVVPAEADFEALARAVVERCSSPE